MKNSSINLKSLAHNVYKRCLRAGLDPIDFSIDRDSDFQKCEFLNKEIIDQLTNVRKVLRELVPNDFDCWVTFSRSSCTLSLEYSDGLNNAFGFNTHFKKWEAFKEDLKGLDWDEVRVNALHANQIANKMVAAASKREVTLRKVADVQEEHLELLSIIKEFEAETKGNWVAYAYRRIDGEILREECQDHDSLITEIRDMMPTGYEIVCVCKEGVILSHREIEAIKQEAIKTLGPISKAKAEGRMACY